MEKNAALNKSFVVTAMLSMPRFSIKTLIARVAENGADARNIDKQTLENYLEELRKKGVLGFSEDEYFWYRRS